MWRKAVVVAVIAALVVGTVGVSLAYADNTSTPATTLRGLFLEKLAGRLGVDQNTLVSDITQAAKDAVQAAQDQGLISSARAAEIEKAIDNGGLWAVLGRGRPVTPVPWAAAFLGPGVVKDVASYLGMTDKDIFTELASGKTLAAIATEHGKTAADLESYLLSQLKTRLDKAVADGKLTQDRETTVLQNAQTAIDRFVNEPHPAYGTGYLKARHGWEQFWHHVPGRGWGPKHNPAPNQSPEQNPNPSGSGT